MDDSRSTARPRKQRTHVFIVANPGSDSDGEAPKPGPSRPLGERPRPQGPSYPSDRSYRREYGSYSSQPKYSPAMLETQLPEPAYPPHGAPPLSPASNSSQAMESTPPPSTPGEQSAMSYDRPPRELRRPPTVVDQIKTFSNKPIHNRTASSTSKATSSPVSDSQSSTMSRPPTSDKIIIAVTTDSEQFFIVDITGARDGAFIREKIFSKVQISDEDQPHFSIYRTEIGAYALGDALSDEYLYGLTQMEGDAKGSLKFFVSHSSAPVHEIPHPHPFSASTPSVNTIPPPVLPYPGDTGYQPLRPNRKSPRSRTGGSVSSASEHQQPQSVGYDAEASEEEHMERNDNRSTMRPPARQQFPPPPSPVSSIPPSVRPQSPSNSLSPSRPPPNSDIPPLHIHKLHRTQVSTNVSPSRSDFDGTNTAQPVEWAEREKGEPADRARRPHHGRQFIRAAPRDHSVDSPREGSDWVFVGRETPPPPSEESSRKVASRQRDKDREARVRHPPSAGGSRPLNIPNAPSIPAPQPPGSRGGQPVWNRMMAKSMNDLRGQFNNGSSGHPPGLTPGVPRRPSNQIPRLPQPNTPGMSPTVGRAIRPLPVHAGSPTSNIPFSSSAPTGLLPVGPDPYIRPSSAAGDRGPPTSNRVQRQRVQSPTLWHDASPSLEESARSPLARSPYTQGMRLNGRPLQPSRTNSRPDAPNPGNQSPPRSPVSPASPRSSIGSSSIKSSTDESVNGTLRQDDHAWISSILDGTSGESTIMSTKKPLPDYAWLSRMPDGTSGESTMVPTKKPLPLAPTVISPSQVSLARQPSFLKKFTGSGMGTNMSSATNDDDDDDTGTSLWLARPKSIAVKGQALTPLQINEPGAPPLPHNPSLPVASSPKPPPAFPPPPPPANQSSSNGTAIPEPFRNALDYPRPPPEDVYDRLDTFFPEHNLDEPVIEAASGGTSPTNVDNPVIPISAVSAAKGAFRHKKSIRVVAAEHKRKIDRTSRLQGSSPSSMMRKRSTKLWGSKVEEVTPAQAQSMMYSVPESPTSSAPKPIFKWVRGELIGKGTYGRVYLALNATTGEMIAVKQVEIPRTASDKEDSRQVTVVEALKSESETLKDLDHPHIVQYLGFEETPNFLSIFLEYVPGGSVGSCLRKHGKFNEDVVKSFTEQILQGLEYLHSRGIIHRDLKADNILVETSGICKISDFGISKRTDDMNQAAFTAMQGTVFWMAPEVVKTGKQGYNSKIDIWSVGCVVLEMWAGRRPWNEEEAVAVMFKLYGKEASPPVPDDVVLTPLADNFRLKCFAINPEERPAAAELRVHPYLKRPPQWTFSGFK